MKKNKNKRLVKIIAIVVVIIAVGSVAFVKLSQYVFDKTIDTVADYTINSFTNSLDSSDSDTSSVSDDKAENGTKLSTKGSVNAVGKDESAIAKSDGKNAENQGTDKKPRKHQWKITSNRYKVSITKKDVTNIKTNTPTTEKISTTAYILSRFSPGDLNEIRSLMAGGMTPEKKEKIKGIVYSKFSQSEIQELIAKYNKYR